MVKELLMDENIIHEEDDEASEFVMQMLDLVKPLIDKYEPDDEFMQTLQYQELYAEIKDSINQYLVKNGLQ